MASSRDGVVNTAEGLGNGNLTRDQAENVTGSMTPIYTPKSSGPVNVIAIHGMNTTSPETWQAKKIEEEGLQGYCNWLSDDNMLPSAIPNSQIWAFHYNTAWLSDAPVERLSNLADKLLLTLWHVFFTSEGKYNNEPPPRLVFICSSYGGVVFAKAVERAKTPFSKHLDILLATVGVVFLGSPLRSGPKLKSYAQWYMMFKGMLTESPSETLQRDLVNETGVLEDLLADFAKTTQLSWLRLQVRCFYELKKTQKAGFKDFVVSKDAACIDTHFCMGLDANHSTMNKFFGPLDRNYGFVKQEISDLVANCERYIRERARLKAPQCLLPFPRNKSLVPREALSQSLNEKLPIGLDDHSAALHGLGGSGKTQAALDFAYRRKDQGYAVFWVHAANPAAFIEDFSKIARIAELDDQLKGEFLLMAVKEWMEIQEQILLILDNADNLNIFQTRKEDDCCTSSDLSLFIPRRPSKLWTSRDTKIVGSLIGDSLGIKVGSMTNEEALLLLRRPNLDLDGTKPPSTAELQLLDYLERLPLAISHAAAYMKQTGTVVENYLRMFNSEKTQVKLLSWEFRDPNRYCNIPTSIMYTWIISMELIAQESPLAREILRTIAFFERQGIPEDLIYAVAGDEFDEFDIADAVGRLISFSFLQRQYSDKSEDITFELHRLVQMTTILSLGNDKANDRKEVALLALNKRFPIKYGDEYDTEKLKSCLKYLPHAERLRRQATYSYQITTMLQDLVCYYYYQSQWREIISVGEQLLDICKESPANMCYDIFSMMENLAIGYSGAGFHSKAAELQIEVIGIRQKVLGKEHPDTLKSMANLASFYYYQSRYREAEELGATVLKLQQKVLGEEYPDTLKSMGNLANVYHNQSRYREAEELGATVLKLQQKVLGEEHPDTLRSMGGLANIYYRQSRYREAEELGATVLKLQQKVLGKEHPDTLTSMANLANVYRHQSRYREAEELGATVLKLQQKVLGKEHPDTLTSIGNLASVYHDQSRYREAEELGATVLELQQKVLGKEHPDTLTSMTNLANVYCCQSRYREAEELGATVLELQQKVLGKEHPDTLTSMAILSSVYYCQSRYREAEELRTTVLELQQKVLGEEHPATLKSMANLASVYYRQSRYREAEELGATVLKLRQKVLGEEHPDTGWSREMLKLYRSRRLEAFPDERDPQSHGSTLLDEPETGDQSTTQLPMETRASKRRRLARRSDVGD